MKKQHKDVSPKANHEKDFNKEQGSNKTITREQGAAEDRGGFFGKRWFPFTGGKK